MSDRKEKGPSPEIELHDGSIRAASWREDGEYGPYYNTKITRRYRNDEGEIRETSSLRERDLLTAANLAQETHRTIRERKRELTQERDQDRNQSEDWHDEDKSRKDIKRERFKEERRSEGTRWSRTQHQSQDR